MLLNAGQFLTERAKISANMEAWVDLVSGERITYRQANARSNQAAHFLLSLGLAPGDRVAALMSDVPRHAEAYFASARAGFVFVELNWRLTVPELSCQLLDSGAAAVLYGEEQRRLVEPLRAQFQGARFVNIDDARTLDRIEAASTREPPIGATLEDPLFMMYTSGTTGRPKGALMPQRANIAEVDEEGFVYLKDRSKDMVISGGENVSPAEVENVLLAHPGVKADGWAGDEVGLTEALPAHVKERLARYKQPKTYAYVDELPLNPSGKILKRVLRERFPGPAPE